MKIVGWLLGQVLVVWCTLRLGESIGVLNALKVLGVVAGVMLLHLCIDKHVKEVR